MRRVVPLVFALGLLASPLTASPRFPNVVLVTVDTLRADRVSAYGYHRPTTPEIDELLADGARFLDARTVEPLTNPAMSSMLTSLYPHQHGASRNGLRLRPGLDSLARTLDDRGFVTAAFVGNWTLKDEISGLGEHFDVYREIFSRKRWLFFKDEATADDLTEAASEWLAELGEDGRGPPFLLWVHYVDPHEPYRPHSEFRERLGLPRGRTLSQSQLYDTEVAFADRSIGVLLDAIYAHSPPEDTLIVFAADHGESLGEHGYWGHGRNLFEPSVRIPMGIVWRDSISPQTLAGPATIIDVAPTVLGLIDHPVPEQFHGRDWSPVLRGEADALPERHLFLQAHKGAVQPSEDGSRARRGGLLEVGVVVDGVKEVLRVGGGRRVVYDLGDDPDESVSLVAKRSPPSDTLSLWHETVTDGLETADGLPPPSLDDEDAERLRALGYID